jgi:type VI secretion system protein ImpM
MQCGVFGKLPMKRDFVAINAPREFLEMWERWMQAALSASREALRQEWQKAFLSAPIWRFWLGCDISGATALGAFMPSLDGVGRYFPLTVFAIAEPGDVIAPPDRSSYDQWFEEAESLLLGALEKGILYDTFLARVNSLAAPRDWKELASNVDLRRMSDGTMLVSGSEATFEEQFSSFPSQEPAELSSAASFWWTLGGDGYPRVAMARRHMPDPFIFAPMLTGRISPETV